MGKNTRRGPVPKSTAYMASTCKSTSLSEGFAGSGWAGRNRPDLSQSHAMPRRFISTPHPRGPLVPKWRGVVMSSYSPTITFPLCLSPLSLSLSLVRACAFTLFCDSGKRWQGQTDSANLRQTWANVMSCRDDSVPRPTPVGPKVPKWNIYIYIYMYVRIYE